MRCTAAATAAAATLVACTCASPPAPIVTSVEPARVESGADTVLTIRGSGFTPVVQADLDVPAASRVEAGFRIEIASGEARVPLAAAALRSSTELSAVLPAFAAAIGTYELVLVDPRGRIASLPAALDVLECLAEGAPCDDGNACTVGDTCVSSSCVPGGEVACPPPPACHLVGVCDPATGACSAVQQAADGAACNDGDACTSGDACQAGVCTGNVSSCPTRSNTPPLACLEVSPAAGKTGTSVFEFDASCSDDAEDGHQLAFSFAWDDGAGWTAPSTSPLATTTYAATGVHTAAVEVTDSGAPQPADKHLHAYAYRTVVTAPDANVLLVTTALDEDDATGTGPGPDGFLSLREAIEWVNGASLENRVIAFDPVTFENATPGNPAVIALRSRLPALTAPGTVIAGRPGVVLDFAAAALPPGWGCIHLAGPRQMLVGLTMVGCPDSAVVIAASSTDSGIVDCTIVGPGAAAATPTSLGVLVQAPVVVGPRNDVSGFYRGVNLRVNGAVVDGNRIHGNIVGVAAHDLDATVQRNDIYGNAGAGLDLSRGPTMDAVLLNTIDGNSGDGIHATGVLLDLRDNLLTWNGGFGLNAIGCSFGAPGVLGPNGYYANASGPVAGTATVGSKDLTEDPLYVSRAAADYRLLPASPAIGKGVDVKLDVNGPVSGNCNGACDLGAHEYPAP